MIDQGGNKNSGALPSNTARVGRPAGTREPDSTMAGNYFCAFWLAERCYALDVSYIGGVIAISTITPVPACAPAIRGLYNLRGTALTIVDLATALEFPGVQQQRGAAGSRALVFHWKHLHAGLPIDRVEAVHPFRMARLIPSNAGLGVEKGVLEFTVKKTLLATLLDGQKVVAQLEKLQIRQHAAQ